MEQYIDKVGSLDKDDLEDKSFGDVTDFIKDEFKSHRDIIAERTENNVRKFVLHFCLRKYSNFRSHSRRIQPRKVASNLHFT